MKLYIKSILFIGLLSTFLGGRLSANRILCLHGGGGSAASLQYQQGMQDLRAALPQWEFVFASSPVAGGVWYNDPPGGGKEPTNDPNWADVAVNYLNDFIATNGPFDAILGYSQGVPMSLVYLALGDHTIGHALLFNGYLPTTHNGLIQVINANAPYPQSALIFVAENDTYFYEIGLAVKNRFTNYTELISMTAGHALPTASDANFQSVVDFLENANSSDTDSGADTGTDTGTDNVRSFRLNILRGDDPSNLELIDTRIIESSEQSQFFKAELVPND